MALTTESPEALAAPRALENDRSSRLVNSENSAKLNNRQYRLITSVCKSGREEFRISIRDFNGTPKIEVRVFERDHAGTWQSTPRHIVIGRGAIAAIISALCEAEARL